MKTFDPMDPGDVDAFTVRFKDLLSGDQITAINSVATDDADVTVGSGAQAPTIATDPEDGTLTNTAVRFYLDVNVAKHSATKWNGHGRDIGVTINVATLAGRTLERTVIVPVRQLS